ncbi:MAG TPA: ATP-binding cassette domain-containing protein [Candidatus Binatia bacterium]|nr:ATP-binding cassette domain-containing protein [Candidatus Binatia bacterium]
MTSGRALPIRVDHLSKRFGGVVAVNDVSLEVGAGEAVAVVGPNGAGKSTLLKAIAGVHRPSDGAVYLDGLRLDHLAPHKVPRHGVVLANQIPKPFGALSVRENLLVAAQARGGLKWREITGRVDDVLERCALADKGDRQARTLAVLDLKRLELARALTIEPSVLLLDEVAAGLVGRELAETIELVGRIHETGVTMILVEHVEQVVSSLVPRVIVLDWGRQIAEGTPEEIRTNPEVRRVYLGARDRAAVAAEWGSKPAAETGPAPLLELRGVSAGYGELLALRDVDLRIDQGEALAVLGANGAGKSTLCSVLSGLVPARQGEVRLNGVDVTREPPHRRARQGIVHCPEGRHVFADLTVAQNLELGAPLSLGRAELRSRLEHVFAIFPALAERTAQRGASLSGGEQQMLAIGRALVSRPRLLICDEISLGLAPTVVDALYEALGRVRAEGVALALIEQNVNRALDVADRVVVLRRGVVAYAGGPAPLYEPAALDDAYFGEADTPADPADGRNTT